MMESRWLCQQQSPTQEDIAHLGILYLQPSRGQYKGDQGSREEHLEDGNISGISRFEAVCERVGGKDSKAS